MSKFKNSIFSFFSLYLAHLLLCSHLVSAQQVLGVHILHPAEISEAARLIKNDYNAHTWSYVTLPLSLNDLDKKDEWQAAFNQARSLKINPLVRLVSRFDPDKNAWTIPTRGEILALFNFLNSLDWPHEHRYIIVFNEVNHRSEWGGVLDPLAYADTLSFVADWAHTENVGYRILPAAMDLAAPNGPNTAEAFTYLNQMLVYQPNLFEKIDHWNSHSYPNPAFSAPPSATGKNSLRGFEHELDWLENKTSRKLSVFITETGWEENSRTRNKLDTYYAYASDKVWSDSRIIAVTPFILKGDPGPFSKFTLLDRDGQPKLSYHAYASAIEKTSQARQLIVPTF